MADSTLMTGLGTGNGVAESAGEGNGCGSFLMDIYTDRQLLFAEYEPSDLNAQFSNGSGESLGDEWHKRYRGF